MFWSAFNPKGQVDSNTYAISAALKVIVNDLALSEESKVQEGIKESVTRSRHYTRATLAGFVCLLGLHPPSEPM
jgi:hypothetical protein